MKELCNRYLYNGYRTACYTSDSQEVEHMTLLQVSHIKKLYGDKHGVVQAIEDLSFQVEEGEFVAVMGASGSGKTTLLNVLATIDEVSAGSIQYDGIDITTMNENEKSDFRKAKIGFIFQDFHLLDVLTMEENIALSLTLQEEKPHKIHEEVLRIAKTLGITEILPKYPYACSGGEKQRAACARALIKHPRIIFADEPTGALDSHASLRLLQTMKQLNELEASTILMVTHDAFSASYAKRVLFLKDGKIFNEMYRGDKGSHVFYQEILQVLTLLGGDLHDIS